MAKKNNIEALKKKIGQAVDGAEKQIWEHENAAAEAAAEVEHINGIRRGTAALYEAGTADDTIVRMLIQFWGLSETDAKDYLRDEKTVRRPARQLGVYLKNDKGFSDQEADDFILDHRVIDILKEKDGLWKLPTSELYEILKEN